MYVRMQYVCTYVSTMYAHMYACMYSQIYVCIWMDTMMLSSEVIKEAPFFWQPFARWQKMFTHQFSTKLLMSLTFNFKVKDGFLNFTDFAIASWWPNLEAYFIYMPLHASKLGCQVIAFQQNHKCSWSSV